MAGMFTNDGAAKNGFGRRTLHVWEAQLLSRATYHAPPSMSPPRGWRLNPGGVPVPPVPTDNKRRDEIVAVRARLSQIGRAHV